MKRLALLATLLIMNTSCASGVPVPTLTPTIEIPPTITATTTPVPTSSPTAQPISTTCDHASTSLDRFPDNSDIVTANQRLSRTTNLGEALEFSDGGNWKWVDKEEIFSVVADAGFTAVRIPIDFAAHSESASPYSIYPGFWNVVDSLVNKALGCGLVVIINMHNFGSEGDLSSWNSDHFVALWEQIAAHYHDYTQSSLYFELFNEPGDPYVWNTLLAQGISTVRKMDATRPIIIGTAEWGGVSGLSKLKLPVDQNLIVSFHYYDPAEFTHQGAHFLPGAVEWLGTLWEGTPEQVAAIDRDFDRVANWAQNRANPVPVFMGEFGSLSYADHDSRVRWTAAVRQAAEEHGFSWGYWDLCNTGTPTFGLFDCAARPVTSAKWDSGLLEALIPPP